MSRIVTKLGRCIGWSFGLMITAVFLCLSLATATVKADAATISQGYSSATSLPLGMLVSTSSTDLTQVSLATIDNVDNLVGVTVTKNSSAIDFSSQNKVQVGTSGTFYVTVSNINGDIKKNDRVTASPIDGVGMKTAAAGKVVGVAQQDLTSTSRQATTKSLSDKLGKTHNILIGQIPVSIDVSFYQPVVPSGNGVVRNIQSFLSSVAGKPISTTRTLLSLLILLIGLIVSTIVVFTSIGASIRAIGRNPLSHRSVNMSLVFVILLVAFLLGGAFLSSYFILTH